MLEFSSRFWSLIRNSPNRDAQTGCRSRACAPEKPGGSSVSRAPGGRFHSSNINLLLWKGVVCLRYTSIWMLARATTISTLIVDDEQLACDELSHLLKDFPDIELVATGRNGLEAIELIEELEPDLVFLDVQMPGIDGLSVIQKLHEKNGHVPHFILATAYDQYALQAFRWQALDYLLKPIEKERLAVTIERARKLIAENAKSAPTDAAPASKPSAQRTKLLVKSN